MFTYACGATTDKGDLRAENQDSVLILTGTFEGQDAALLVVADGMGGLSYGAQVSRYITEQFEYWWREDFPSMVKVGMESDEDIRELLEQEIWDINQAIFQFKERLRCRTGSTLSLLLLYGSRYYIENIGDSRVYRLQAGSLQQLTQDQSLIAKMMKEQGISEEEAERSNVKNVLTMCVGMFPVPKSCFRTGKISDGDCFLLCSDGFYHPLSRGQIAEVLGRQDMSPQQKAQHLRQMIGRGKASDNVSAIIAEVQG